MNSKKLLGPIAILLVVLVIPSAAPHPVSATDAAVISAPAIVDLTLVAGKTVTFAINVSNVGPVPETLYSWQFYLQVNATLLKVTQVVEGPALSDIATALGGSTLFASNINATTGLVKASDLLVISSGYPDAGLVGGGVLAYVKALVLTSGHTDLVFDTTNLHTVLYSIQGSTSPKIGFTVVNGVFANVPYNIPPTASFTINPDINHIIAGNPVYFDASASSDRDGTIVKYTWLFGDANTTSVTVPTIAHTYSTPGGPFKAFLTVTDNGGATATVNMTFYVGNPHPPPVAIFTFSPANPRPGETVTFNGSASHATPPSQLVNQPCVWSFGDGVSGGGCIVRHAYPSAGNYTVTLVVTDTNLQRANATEVVSITGAAVLKTGNATPWWELPTGAVAAIVVVAAGLFLWRRRRSRRGEELEEEDEYR